MGSTIEPLLGTTPSRVPLPASLLLPLLHPSDDYEDTDDDDPFNPQVPDPRARGRRGWGPGPLGLREQGLGA